MNSSQCLKEFDRLITKEYLQKWNANDMSAFLACIRKDKKSLDCEFHPRMLIDALKNFPDELDFLLSYLTENEFFERSDPGSYFFSEIIDNRSFDVYKKYNIDSFKLIPNEIPKEQLEYIYSIGFIDDEQYNIGLYGHDIAEIMKNDNLTYEEYLEQEKNEKQYEVESDERNMMENEDYGVNEYGGYSINESDSEDDERESNVERLISSRSYSPQQIPTPQSFGLPQQHQPYFRSYSSQQIPTLQSFGLPQQNNMNRHLYPST